MAYSITLPHIRIAPNVRASIVVLLCTTCVAQAVRAINPLILQRFPHDTSAFTQGLLVRNGVFMESTGLYGNSSLREVAIETGQVKRKHNLDTHLFGEGLALLPGRSGDHDHLLQLTWREGQALEYDAADFMWHRTFEYNGEGWGLCCDSVSRLLVMSDGTATLTFRDTDTFSIKRRLDVTLDGSLLSYINDLECVDGHIYANVFGRDMIIRIDSRTGKVDCVVNARGLLNAQEQVRAGVVNGVLNGIAYDNEANSFFITGKHWPWVFQVDLDACNVPPTLTNSFVLSGIPSMFSLAQLELFVGSSIAGSLVGCSVVRAFFRLRLLV